MTKVIINPGACGMQAVVVVEKQDGKTFSLSITSACPMAVKLGEELPELTMMDAFKRFQDNPVYKKGGACLKHVACPVPSGVLKALEVEAGLNVPKDVFIAFQKDETIDTGE